ncbi:hypothetical protein [Moraxella oblonga]|uniref:hypothetical protein n=1 Tax=Moraxella oblonga TaxID=200413 RepID=UPI0008299101|nr:hypothetical protein [Moraxella oblonga]
MKKIIALSFVAMLGLTACEKPTSQPTEKTETATPQTNTTPTPPEQHAQDNAHAGHTHEHDDHAHEGHNHEGHDHASHGDAYQCGDKTIHIAIHEHEGEHEAHLTQDDITYDLNESENGKFISDDDSIDGSEKGMALKLDGNKATVSTPDDKVLLDCTKA